MKLSDLLTDEQCAEIARIINENSDYLKRINALKAYLNQFKDELEKKKVLPDYLAYLIEVVTQEKLRLKTKFN